MRFYVAFDIEIARTFPDGVEDWRPFRPFGISCAATLTSAGSMTVWHGRTAGSEAPADQMSRDEIVALVQHLESAVANGATILTWNGLGFDFDVLAEESGLVPRCRDLALDHVDMMFHVFCQLGYAVGLDRAAKGVGLAGKTPGMDGALAPKLWAQGRRQEVLDYVQQDVRTTLALARAGEHRRALQWLDSRGRFRRLPLPSGWLTVREAAKLPLPDVSWMSNPWSRRRFTDWMTSATPDQPALPGLQTAQTEE